MPLYHLYSHQQAICAQAYNSPRDSLQDCLQDCLHDCCLLAGLLARQLAAHFSWTAYRTICRTARSPACIAALLAQAAVCQQGCLPHLSVGQLAGLFAGLPLGCCLFAGLLAALPACSLTCRCTSAACRTSLIMSACNRSSSRFSALVSRHRLSSLYDCHSPSGNLQCSQQASEAYKEELKGVLAPWYMCQTEGTVQVGCDSELNAQAQLKLQSGAKWQGTPPARLLDIFHASYLLTVKATASDAPANRALVMCYSKCGRHPSQRPQLPIVMKTQGPAACYVTSALVTPAVPVATAFFTTRTKHNTQQLAGCMPQLKVHSDQCPTVPQQRQLSAVLPMY